MSMFSLCCRARLRRLTRLAGAAKGALAEAEAAAAAAAVVVTLAPCILSIG